MPKVTLSYTLPEEREEYAITMAAGDYYAVLFDLDNFLRSKLKYEELTESDEAVYRDVRRKLNDLISEYNVEI